MKTGQTDDLHQELESLLIGRWLTDLSNFAALFFDRTENLNWIGFYIFDGKMLQLGPFHGRPACTKIAIGRGVCGTAFQKKEILNVPDTHQFPGHIACDERSLSELVIPMIKEGKVIGVLDIDSPVRNRFSSEDVLFFQKALEILLKKNSHVESSFLEKMFSV